MTDPIADMLARIRNALVAEHKSLELPSSKLKAEVARVLKEQGFIGDYDVVEKEPGKKSIMMVLSYTPDGEKVIKNMRRVSKPGRRVYVNKDTIPRVRGGLGVSILSTSRGVMTGGEARSLGVGGEVICEIE